MTYSLGGEKKWQQIIHYVFIKRICLVPKGQEVEELLSISLDPDVEIEELDHEVIVRGQLDLTESMLQSKMIQLIH